MRKQGVWDTPFAMLVGLYSKRKPGGSDTSCLCHESVSDKSCVNQVCPIPLVPCKCFYTPWVYQMGPIPFVPCNWFIPHA